MLLIIVTKQLAQPNAMKIYNYRGWRDYTISNKVRHQWQKNIGVILWSTFIVQVLEKSRDKRAMLHHIAKPAS